MIIWYNTKIIQSYLMSRIGLQKITVWENDSRIELLREFRTLLMEYFEEENKENPDPRVIDERRRKINHILNRAIDVIEETGVTCHFSIPNPNNNNAIIRFNYLEHIFQIKQYHVNPQGLIDAIDRATGVYIDNSEAAFRRTWNPFYWIGFGTDQIARFPFYFVSLFGFSQKRLEATKGGKFIHGSIQAFVLLFFITSLVLTSMTDATYPEQFQFLLYYINPLNHFTASLFTQ